VQTAEGALGEIHDMLQRMDELATKAANGTLSQGDRQNVQDEIDSLLTEIDRVSETTKFNETYLLKGDSIGGTKDVIMNAHDAGLKGKLEVSADGTTATFTMDTVQSGDSVNIGGKTYTIDDHSNGSITETDQTELNDHANADVTLTATADASGNITWSGGDGDPSYYGLTVEGAEDGDTITITKYTAGSEAVEAAPAKTEGSSGVVLTGYDAANITVDEDVTLYYDDANSNWKTQDDLGGTAFSDWASIGLTGAPTGASAGSTITVTAAVEGSAAVAEVPATATYNDAAKAKAGENVIKADDAYTKAKEALEQANSIGATGTVVQDATDKNKFTITMGKAQTANSLSFNLHVGADADMTNKIGVSIEAMNTSYLGIKGLDVVGKDASGNKVNDGGVAATYAIDAIEDAIKKVSNQRSALGAVQNRLEHTVKNLDNIVENTTSAESEIRDTDMATEMVTYSKNNILAQAGQSMLAQANQSNQGVLSLLG
jgi:flagellin